MDELRPIGQRTTLAETMIAVKTQNWIFEKPIEKIILALCVGWAGFSIVKFVWGFLI